MTERDTVVGVFEDRTAAQQAINELKRIGFTDDQIGVMARDSSRVEGDPNIESDNYAAEGGAAGLATGAGVGALWGLGIVAGALPAIGPAIAGGTLAAILTSAAAGAAAAGLAGTLIGLGIPKKEAEYYESEVEAGRVVVTVRTDGRYTEALAVMRRFGGYDMSTREGADREFEAGEFDEDYDEVDYPVPGRAATTGKTPVVHPEQKTPEHRTFEVPVQRDDVMEVPPASTVGEKHARGEP
jgi:hypothetical protein